MCAKKCKGYTHQKNSKQCKEALLSVFSIKVADENDDIYPPLVCHCCYLTLRQIQGAMEAKRFRETDLVPHVWSPHSDSCQLCQDAYTIPRGRPRKRKAKGRPSDSDTHHHYRKLMHHLSTLSIPKYALSNVHISHFFPTPYLDNVICQICKMVPSQPVQILSCHHLICVSCLQSESTTEGEVSCPCNSQAIHAIDVSVPSDLSSKVLGSLLLHCEKGCGQVVEFRHYNQHRESQCEHIPVPPPSKITVEQLLQLETTSLLHTNTMGLLIEKLIPSTGSVTFRSPTGKVIT